MGAFTWPLPFWLGCVLAVVAVANEVVMSALFRRIKIQMARARAGDAAVELAATEVGARAAHDQVAAHHRDAKGMLHHAQWYLRYAYRGTFVVVSGVLAANVVTLMVRGQGG